MSEAKKGRYPAHLNTPETLESTRDEGQPSIKVLRLAVIML